MADLTLDDGKEINFDLKKITLGEWRNLTDGDISFEEQDQIALNVSGLTLEEYSDLSLYDIKRFWLAFMEKRMKPLDDPNSVSVSTST